MFMASPISSATRTASSKEEYASLPRDDVKLVPPSRRTFIKASAKPVASGGLGARVSLNLSMCKPTARVDAPTEKEPDVKDAPSRFWADFKFDGSAPKPEPAAAAAADACCC